MEFDKGVMGEWGELVREQNKEMEALGVPYFGVDGEEENRRKILAFLEDFVSGGKD